MPDQALYDQALKAASFLRSKFEITPRLALFLGSGYAPIIELITNRIEVLYHEIPYMSTTTVEGHTSALYFGEFYQIPVMMWGGRMHYYEGYSMDDITFPVRVSKLMNVEHAIFTNAAGGINTAYNIGDLVLIKDHINLFPANPLRGYNDPRWGLRFPDTSEVYNINWIKKTRETGKLLNIPLHEGVYVGVSGPSLETPAEYRYLRIIGADVVGMSTVPEVLVAHQLGIKILGISIVSNIVNEEGHSDIQTTHEEVLLKLKKAMPTMVELFQHLIPQL